MLLTDASANIDRYKGYYTDLQAAYNDQFGTTKNIIEKDIRRTYAKEITKEQKEALFRILFSYAKRNGKLGYCQGMNVLAYFLLNFGFTEEQSFWILAYIVETLIPKGYYTNMVAVISDISLLKHLFAVLLPYLATHFQKYAIDVNHFLVPWFLMAFTNIDNLEVS